jgi:hypothetical protein
MIAEELAGYEREILLPSPSCLILRYVFILKISLLDLESDTRIVPDKIYSELIHGSFGLILDGPSKVAGVFL